MSYRHTQCVLAFFVLFFLLITAGQADGVRIRGELMALEGNLATVKTPAGEVAQVQLANPYKVLLYKNIDVTEIPDNAYVSIPSTSADGDKVTAMSINVFPEAMRGFNEGFAKWDLGVDSNMTNATVATVIGQQDKTTLTVSFLGKSQHVTVNESTPVTTFDIAPSYQIKIGQNLVIFAEDHGDRFSATFVGVWENGELPPI